MFLVLLELDAGQHLVLSTVPPSELPPAPSPSILPLLRRLSQTAVIGKLVGLSRLFRVCFVVEAGCSRSFKFAALSPTPKYIPRPLGDLIALSLASERCVSIYVFVYLVPDGH